jgi:hypothetical protein
MEQNKYTKPVVFGLSLDGVKYRPLYKHKDVSEREIIHDAISAFDETYDDPIFPNVLYIGNITANGKFELHDMNPYTGSPFLMSWDVYGEFGRRFDFTIKNCPDKNIKLYLFFFVGNSDYTDEPAHDYAYLEYIDPKDPNSTDNGMVHQCIDDIQIEDGESISKFAECYCKGNLLIYKNYAWYPDKDDIVHDPFQNEHDTTYGRCYYYWVMNLENHKKITFMSHGGVDFSTIDDNGCLLTNVVSDEDDVEVWISINLKDMTKTEVKMQND